MFNPSMDILDQIRLGFEIVGSCLLVVFAAFLLTCARIVLRDGAEE